MGGVVRRGTRWMVVVVVADGGGEWVAELVVTLGDGSCGDDVCWWERSGVN